MLCKIHRGYVGDKKPIAHCADCYRIWRNKNGGVHNYPQCGHCLKLYKCEVGEVIMSCWRKGIYHHFNSCADFESNAHDDQAR